MTVPRLVQFYVITTIYLMVAVTAILVLLILDLRPTPVDPILPDNACGTTERKQS